MNTKAKLFTGVIALAIATSAILSATSASARPYDDDQYDGNNNGVSWGQRDRYDRLEDRYDRLKDRYKRLNDRDYRYNNRQNVYIYRPYQLDRSYYNRSIVRLPSGCRRVVYRGRSYYTLNNYDYYTYDSNRSGYIVVNLPGIRIGF
jgi:hypothetical protein